MIASFRNDNFDLQLSLNDSIDLHRVYSPVYSSPKTSTDIFDLWTVFGVLIYC
jgi:hypothetical protein